MSKCKSHNTLSTANSVRGGNGVISQVQSELTRHYPSIMDSVPTINSCPSNAPGKSIVQGHNLSCYPNPVANMKTAAHRGINPLQVFPEPTENEFFDNMKVIKKTDVKGNLFLDGDEGILFMFDKLASSSDPEKFTPVTTQIKKFYVSPHDVISINGKPVDNGMVSGEPLHDYMKRLKSPNMNFIGKVSIELLENSGNTRNKGVINQYSTLVRDEIMGEASPDMNTSEIAKNRLAKTVASFGVNKLKFGEHDIPNQEAFGYSYSSKNNGPYDQYDNSRKRNSPLVNEKYRENTRSMFNKSHMLGGQGKTQDYQFARNFDRDGLLLHYTHGAAPITQRDYYAMENVADGNCDFDITSSTMADMYKDGNMNTDNTDIMYQGEIGKDWNGFQGNFKNDFR